MNAIAVSLLASSCLFFLIRCDAGTLGTGDHFNIGDREMIDSRILTVF